MLQSIISSTQGFRRDEIMAACSGVMVVQWQHFNEAAADDAYLDQAMYLSRPHARRFCH
jgi:hypothetical protein